MSKNFTQTTDFCTKYKATLKTLSTEPNTEIVLCPSFPALFSVAEILSDTMVSVGAQTCSAYEDGAYTGQVSAKSLKEVGCDYCIIGHSEQRKYACISNDVVARQATQLFKNNIQPIICIGENQKEFDQKQGYAVLEQQLSPILDILASHKQPFTIAYEPIWSIGTGIIPSLDYLNEIFDWLEKTIQNIPGGRLLYGGSVHPDNAASLTTIQSLGGFLIGGASLDFQKFQKIVSLGR